MKAGELGRISDPISHPLPFMTDAKPDARPPFPSVACYDAKAWEYIPKNTGKDVLFWNVGREPHLIDETIPDRIDSYRDWPKNIAAAAAAKENV
jgi:hypothetical protein